MCCQYIMRLPRYTRKRCSTLTTYLVVTNIWGKKTDRFFKNNNKNNDLFKKICAAIRAAIMPICHRVGYK